MPAGLSLVIPAVCRTFWHLRSCKFRQGFAPCEALYIRVVRSEGPQVNLIDLPGLTHDKMEDIHEARPISTDLKGPNAPNTKLRF